MLAHFAPSGIGTGESFCSGVFGKGLISEQAAANRDGAWLQSLVEASEPAVIC
jgi:hypothetical protein